MKPPSVHAQARELFEVLVAAEAGRSLLAFVKSDGRRLAAQAWLLAEGFHEIAAEREAEPGKDGGA